MSSLQPYPRPIAICLFRNNSRILVTEGFDAVKQQTFYRPLGGRIEYGEHSRETIAREINEELGVAVTGLRYLFTIENIFTYNGTVGHEIVQVYDGAFADKTIYAQPILRAVESNGIPFKAVWKELAEFDRPASPPLYPSGLLDLILALQ